LVTAYARYGATGSALSLFDVVGNIGLAVTNLGAGVLFFVNSLLYGLAVGILVSLGFVLLIIPGLILAVAAQIGQYHLYGQYARQMGIGERRKRKQEEIEVGGMAGFDDFEQDFEPQDEEFTAEEQAREEAFLQEVRKRRVMLRRAKKYPAKDRIEAARWLGEAGDPSAIPELVLVYRKDPTPGMKETAAYSLGMMKALEEALNDPDEAEYALDLTRDIILKGKFGRQGRRLRPILAVLSVTFIVFLGAALALAPPGDGGTIASGDDTQEAESVPADATDVAAVPTSETEGASALATSTPAPSATPTQELSATEQLAAYYAALEADASALHEQFLLVTRQSQMQDCNYPFNDPEPYVVPVGVENRTMMEGISMQLNEVRETLAGVRAVYTEACNFRRRLTRQEALDQDDLVVEAQRRLRQDIQPLLGELGVQAPTSEASDTSDAEPTQDITAARVHITALEDIIISMTGIRGEAVRIQTYWNDIAQFGTSEGCFQSEPLLPEPYTLPDDVATEFPSLQAAADLVNTGLGLTQQAATGFYNACNNDTLQQDLGTFQEQANGAVQAFQSAQELLDALLRSG